MNENVSENSKAISIRNLRFAYRATATILSIPSLEIQRGENIFVHGPSGSGKTTLLGILTGILQADEGEVRVLNQNLSKLSATARDSFRAIHIGYIFQQFNLIPYLNVLENILLPCWNSRERSKRVGADSLMNEAWEIARRLGLENFLESDVTRLSVGQQQRVAVARSLIGRPEILIADEPTSSLDEDRQRDFLSLLLERARESKTTVIFVSHNRLLASSFDRSLSLSELNQISSAKESA